MKEQNYKWIVRRVRLTSGYYGLYSVPHNANLEPQRDDWGMLITDSFSVPTNDDLARVIAQAMKLKTLNEKEDGTIL